LPCVSGLFIVVSRINFIDITISAYMKTHSHDANDTRRHWQNHRNRDSCEDRLHSSIEQFSQQAKHFNYLPDLSEEPLDFPVDLGVVYPGEDELDVVMIKEIP